MILFTSILSYFYQKVHRFSYVLRSNRYERQREYHLRAVVQQKVNRAQGAVRFFVEEHERKNNVGC